MKYEARFLYADWEEALEGKQVVYTDSISLLLQSFEDVNKLKLRTTGI